MKYQEAPELFWLAATVVLSGILWIPYVANRFRELGPPGWGLFPLPDPPPRARWAGRMVQAHANAVENLVIFAPLALSASVLGQHTVAAWACPLYFAARLAHAVVTVSGLPIPVRTAAFLTGFAACMALGLAILQATCP